jgi:hypothetical protein
VGVYDDKIELWNFTIDIVINVSFLIDMILTFFTAYEDRKLNVIDDHKVRKHQITKISKLPKHIWQDGLY